MTERARKYKANREDFGTIRARSSGRLQASYVGPDGVRYNAPLTFTARTDARTWLAGVRTEIERGAWRSPKEIASEVFGVYAETWITQRTNSKGVSLRPKTATEYRRQLAKGLALFAEDRLIAISPARVRAWHASRATTAASAAGAEARFLRAILATAVEDGIIQSNPVPSKLTKTSAGKTYRPPTPEELAILVESMPERLRLAVMIAAFGGLRLSEWRALRRRDLTRAGANFIIDVHRQAQRVNGLGWVIGPPKSDRGIRLVTLPAWLTDDVEAHLAEFVGQFPDSLLFAPQGRTPYLHDAAFGRPWVVAQEAAEVRGQVREHDLRGYAGSHALAAGANIIEVRDFLGHANSSTTERHYLHKVNDRAAEIANAMPQLAKPEPSRIIRIASAQD